MKALEILTAAATSGSAASRSDADCVGAEDELAAAGVVVATGLAVAAWARALVQVHAAANEPIRASIEVDTEPCVRGWVKWVRSDEGEESFVLERSDLFMTQFHEDTLNQIAL